MPADHYDDEDESKELNAGGSNSRHKEFDCPDCNANNPVDEGIGNGDEVLCLYCGCEYKVLVNDDGRMKLKAT